MTVYYKLLDDGQKSGHGGSGGWTPGEWREVEGPLVPCENGLHFVTAGNLLVWVHKECWLFEDGSPDETIGHDDKLVTRKGRITVRVNGWNDRNLRLFAADCAERVLPLFEAHFPDDGRPRAALVAARKFANGEIGHKELAAAWDAAWAAAWAAAGDAAWDAEREWQAARLMDYLEGRA